MYASLYSETHPDEAGAVHGLASSMTSSLTSNIGSSPTTPNAPPPWRSAFDGELRCSSGDGN